MSDDRFKFISPGVFIEEIDKSVVPALGDRMGPVVVGRFRKGPSNRPIKVKDYNELVEVFGAPAPGNASGDIWRTAAMTAPTYAAYAAQSWLRNNTPCTIVRLLGVEHEDATGYGSNPTSVAGWRTDNLIAKTPTGSSALGGAYGLLVMPDPDAVSQGATTSSVDIQLGDTADALPEWTIRVGVPNHLAGGVSTGTAAPTDSQALIFNFTDNIAAPDADTIDVLTTAATTAAAISGAMANFVALINGGAVASPNSAAGAIAGVASLAGVQAALSASWNDADHATKPRTLELHSKVAGNTANNIRVWVDEDLLAGDGTEIQADVQATATITTTGNPGDDETFTLTDGAGLAVPFIFKDDVTTVNGTKEGSNVIIGIQGAIGSAAAVGDRIRAAINASDLAMAATETAGGAMTLKQDGGGSAGDNSTPDMSGVTTCTSTVFTGGDDGSHGLITLGATGTLSPSDNSGANVAAITASAPAAVTGTLAATWYVQDGYVQLMGNPRDALAAAASPVTSSGVWIRSTGGQKFHARVMSGVSTSSTGTLAQGASFNFDPTSDRFIRKSFNTDPTATNSELVDTAAGGVVQKYWLGETFEDTVRSHMKVTTAAGTVQSASAAGDFLGCVVGLKRTTPTTDWADRTTSAAAGGTGWFFSQDKRGETVAEFDPTSDTCVEKLFRFVALDNGEHTNREVKISLADIKQPANNFVKYGSFTVLVRAAEDTDSSPVILERFTGVNLDPTSSKYLARVMGDKEYAYDPVSKTVRQYGAYGNRSNYVRAVVSPYVDSGNASGLLPFGVYGPVVPDTLEVREQATHTNATDIDNLSLTGAFGAANPVDIGDGLWVVGANGLPSASVQDLNLSAVTNVNVSTIDGDGADTVVWDAGTPAIDAAIAWPSNRIRVSASEGGLVRQTQAYFGYQANRAGTRIFSEENLDHFRGAPDGLDMVTPVLSASHYSWIFTLDDVVVSSSADGSVASAVHTTGSRADNTSKSALSGANAILDAGFTRFTSPVFGGHDGLDITEKDPFRNRYLSTGSSATTNYAWNTIERAINTLSDPEFIEFDTAAVPGLTNETLTDQLVVACEQRADALAIIDLKGSYEPPHEGIDSGVATSRRTGSVDDVVANMKARGLNSSYGCAFFPFVQIRDTVSDAILFVPPSVVALGTMSSSQRKSAVWFAPAGFTRGGLSEGSAGLPVVGVRTRVTSDQRDKLYDANINPIASFPAEGIVVFGQKTLQVTPSALDRINVRRLLIYLKKEISRIASRTLFEQNVQSTWDRFKGEVNPFLAGVKAGLGLTDYRLVLDKTTTTDELVDRNIMYAKIFIKPARAIEFIALDFIITRSGASFDD